ncbi:Hypothetical predicted protein [Cloeon dipterum]|uniref:Uncharacterized protein n=1 Tax=Cloeon dipterum TaxID=197152 RepID=A0A8S1CJY6_9INSE|nr:Hypothetical predicted protein [Cloeon dipterum]
MRHEMKVAGQEQASTASRRSRADSKSTDATDTDQAEQNFEPRTEDKIQGKRQTEHEQWQQKQAIILDSSGGQAAIDLIAKLLTPLFILHLHHSALFDSIL